MVHTSLPPPSLWGSSHVGLISVLNNLDTNDSETHQHSVGKPDVRKFRKCDFGDRTIEAQSLLPERFVFLTAKSAFNSDTLVCDFALAMSYLTTVKGGMQRH